MKTILGSTLAVYLLSLVSIAAAADWEIVPSPSVGSGANSLAGVSSVSDNDVWAVGWAYNTQLGVYRTVIEHWTGTKWSVVKSRNTTNGYNFLNGVAAAAANDVWAVGQAVNGSTYSTLVEHWNGSRWSVVSSPNVPGLSSSLQAITVVSAKRRR